MYRRMGPAPANHTCLVSPLASLLVVTLSVVFLCLSDVLLNHAGHRGCRANGIPLSEVLCLLIFPHVAMRVECAGEAPAAALQALWPRLNVRSTDAHGRDANPRLARAWIEEWALLDFNRPWSGQYRGFHGNPFGTFTNHRS